ncbi:hypothetical protein B5P43_18500 [Bacillus sp. SRB_336]|nr:hypothetical protein B5P43_18500 [Bacillus sp. SRB_336]
MYTTPADILAFRPLVAVQTQPEAMKLLSVSFMRVCGLYSVGALAKTAAATLAVVTCFVTLAVMSTIGKTSVT